MSDIKSDISTHFIPINMFEVCLIDKCEKRNIINMYPTRKDGAYYLNKFSNYLKDNYKIEFKEYCKEYLNFNWPKCPVSGVETGFKLDGKGVKISKFAQGKISKEHCPNFAQACDKFSQERKGKGNPMFGRKAWNSGLDASHPTIALIAAKNVGRKTSEEARLKQSESAKRRKVHGHTGKKHSTETIKKLRENTAKMYQEKRYNRVTQIEIKVRDFLNELDLEFSEQYFFKYYSLDFALEKYKICIECQGTYFHVDPRIYPNGPISKVQKRNFGRDKAKKKFLNNNGWTLIELWETEINDGQFKDILICKLKELKVLEV